MPALLFDENLSHRLVQRLQAEYPGSLHVEDLGLRGAPDGHLWNEAAQRGLIVLSKDDDFRQRALAYGPPPKVVWLPIGNLATSGIVKLMQRHVLAIRAFAEDPETALLIVS